MFIGFSIISAVLGVLIAICYGQTVGFFPPHVKGTTVIIILGIIESVIGVWTVVCLCLMNFCACCCTPAQRVRNPKVINRSYKSVNLKLSSSTLETVYLKRFVWWHHKKPDKTGGNFTRGLAVSEFSRRFLTRERIASPRNRIPSHILHISELLKIRQ